MKWHRRLQRVALIAVVTSVLVGCNTSNLKPNFWHHESAPAAPEIPVDASLTPRELLTAHLANARRADSKYPGLTVGKLIEYADRYLACDCANARFAKAWRHVDGGYELTTNANQVRPLHFVCSGEATALDCYLTEIDRGPQQAKLTERFMPGTDFIEFIYQQGSSCPRTTPCPATGTAPKDSE